MNSRERIAAALSGRVPDRVPLFLNVIEHGAFELGMGVERYFSRPEHVIEGQLRLIEKLGHDIAWAFSYAGQFAEFLGCDRMIWTERGSPNVGRLVLAPEGMSRFRFPLTPDEVPNLERTLRAIRGLAERLAGEVPVAVALISSFTLPTMLMGIDAWMGTLLFGDRGATIEFIERASSFVAMLSRAFSDAGAGAFAYVSSLASVDIFTLPQISELVMPSLALDAERIALPMVYFNGGGRIGPTIPELLTRTPFRAFFLHPFDDIQAAKAAVGDRGAVIGCVNDVRISREGKAYARAEVERLMNQGKAGARFGLGTLLVPPSAPIETLAELASYAREMGRYG
jgi:uroporphyrinogen decarboxylase